MAPYGAAKAKDKKLTAKGARKYLTGQRNEESDNWQHQNPCTGKGVPGSVKKGKKA